MMRALLTEVTRRTQPLSLSHQQQQQQQQQQHYATNLTDT
jgi:hypothetical protein